MLLWKRQEQMRRGTDTVVDCATVTVLPKYAQTQTADAENESGHKSSNQAQAFGSTEMKGIRKDVVVRMLGRKVSAGENAVDRGGTAAVDYSPIWGSDGSGDKACHVA